MLIEQLIWLLVRDVGVDDGVADFKILQVELRQVLIPAQCTVVTSTIQDRVQVAQTQEEVLMQGATLKIRLEQVWLQYLQVLLYFHFYVQWLLQRDLNARLQQKGTRIGKLGCAQPESEAFLAQFLVLTLADVGFEVGDPRLLQV